MKIPNNKKQFWMVEYRTTEYIEHFVVSANIVKQCDADKKYGSLAVLADNKVIHFDGEFISEIYKLDNRNES